MAKHVLECELSVYCLPPQLGVEFAGLRFFTEGFTKSMHTWLECPKWLQPRHFLVRLNLCEKVQSSPILSMTSTTFDNHVLTQKH